MTLNNPIKIKVDGNYAYICTKKIDISDPQKPILINVRGKKD